MGGEYPSNSFSCPLHLYCIFNDECVILPKWNIIFRNILAFYDANARPVLGIRSDKYGSVCSRAGSLHYWLYSYESWNPSSSSGGLSASLMDFYPFWPPFCVGLPHFYYSLPRPQPVFRASVGLGICFLLVLLAESVWWLLLWCSFIMPPQTHAFYLLCFSLPPSTWHLFILVTYSNSPTLSLGPCLSPFVFFSPTLFISLFCGFVGEFININEFGSMKVKLKFTSVSIHKRRQRRSQLCLRSKSLGLIGTAGSHDGEPVKSCLELCISVHSKASSHTLLSVCAFPILILLSKPPDISFLIPYSDAFFRGWVWKLYLSGCLLFGLIICQKKLPQIEYLHKFIETAIGREMFYKGKENIEGVVFAAPPEATGWYLLGSLLSGSLSWFLVGLFVMLCLEYNSGWRKEN